MYRHEHDGRPVARATDASAESRVLADFLTQDVPWPDYAETLTVAGAEITGNAYAVAFGAENVTLTHLHLPDVAVQVPRARFVAALNEWAAFLRDG
jgi:hypothetical protein